MVTKTAENPEDGSAMKPDWMNRQERLRSALAVFRARKPEPTLTSYSAQAVNGLIDAIEEALEP